MGHFNILMLVNSGRSKRKKGGVPGLEPLFERSMHLNGEIYLEPDNDNRHGQRRMTTTTKNANDSSSSLNFALD